MNITNSILGGLLLTAHQERRIKDLLKRAYDRGYRAGQKRAACPTCETEFAPDFLSSVCGHCLEIEDSKGESK